MTALLEANGLELACHAIRPGTPLVACGFPGITKERVKFWRDHAVRNGLLQDPKAAPPKAPQRKLFGGRGKSNGSAAETAPALAAKGAG